MLTILGNYTLSVTAALKDMLNRWYQPSVRNETGPIDFSSACMKVIAMHYLKLARMVVVCNTIRYDVGYLSNTETHPDLI